MSAPETRCFITGGRVQKYVTARTTGHKSMTVRRRYIREENLFIKTAAPAVGL
jgi:hypothetical protein